MKGAFRSRNFRPVFGVGAPGANTPRNMPYFDTSTNPFTSYVYNGGWQRFGSGGNNVTQIQGVNVSATAPTNGQILTDVAGVWTPQ